MISTAPACVGFGKEEPWLERNVRFASFVGSPRPRRSVTNVLLLQGEALEKKEGRKIASLARLGANDGPSESQGQTRSLLWPSRRGKQEKGCARQREILSGILLPWEAAIFFTFNPRSQIRFGLRMLSRAPRTGSLRLGTLHRGGPFYDIFTASSIVAPELGRRLTYRSRKVTVPTRSSLRPNFAAPGKIDPCQLGNPLATLRKSVWSGFWTPKCCSPLWTRSPCDHRTLSTKL